MSSENVVFRFKRGTIARWLETNYVLDKGEPGFETDGKKRFKVGDGSTPWNSLEYAAGGLSAYDIAVQNGFVGTEQEWLQLLFDQPSEALIQRITEQVIASTEPEIDLVVLFNNALTEGQ